MTPAIQSRAIFFIEQAIAQWEPRVQVLNVRVENSRDSNRASKLGTLHFFVEYRITESGEIIEEGLGVGDGLVQLVPLNVG